VERGCSTPLHSSQNRPGRSPGAPRARPHDGGGEVTLDRYRAGRYLHPRSVLGMCGGGGRCLERWRRCTSASTRRESAGGGRTRRAGSNHGRPSRRPLVLTGARAGPPWAGPPCPSVGSPSNCGGGCRRAGAARHQLAAAWKEDCRAGRSGKPALPAPSPPCRRHWTTAFEAGAEQAKRLARDRFHDLESAIGWYDRRPTPEHRAGLKRAQAGLREALRLGARTEPQPRR